MEQSFLTVRPATQADLASATAELDIDDSDREELAKWIEGQEIELIEEDPAAPPAAAASAACGAASPAGRHSPVASS